MIKFSCSCGKEYQVREQLAGREIKCSQCLQNVVIPEPSKSVSPSPATEKDDVDSGVVDLMDVAIKPAKSSGTIPIIELPPRSPSAPAGGQASSPPSSGSADTIPIAGMGGRETGSAKKRPFGTHRNVRPLTVGAIANVVTAFDESLRREVIIKELLPNVVKNPDVVKEFVSKAELLASLEHPGIPPIFQFDRDEFGSPYYSMKYIKGRPLHELIYEFHNTRTEEQLRDLVRRLVEVAQAANCAHAKGFIHRNITPSSILCGPRGETYLCDWNLAAKFRVLNAEASRYANDVARIPQPAPLSSRPMLPILGPVVGTSVYLSPEQATGDMAQMAPQSDIYMIGAILYEILAGEQPYSGEDNDVILQKIRTMPPPRPSEANKTFEVSRGLELICLKAMRRQAQDRYVSALSLADDLVAWLDDAPLSVDSDTAVDKVVRWVRQNKVAATRYGVAGLLVFFLLIAGPKLVQTAIHTFRNTEGLISGSRAETEAAKREAINAQLQAHAMEKKAKEDEEVARRAVRTTQSKADSIEQQIQQKKAAGEDTTSLEQEKQELDDQLKTDKATVAEAEQKARDAEEKTRAAEQQLAALQSGDGGTATSGGGGANESGGNTGSGDENPPVAPEAANMKETSGDAVSSGTPPKSGNKTGFDGFPAVSAQSAREAHLMDIEVQGEYMIKQKDGKRPPTGLQVVAQGNGRFNIYAYQNGFPGEAWRPGDARNTETLTRHPNGYYTMTTPNGTDNVSFTNGVLRSRDGTLLEKTARKIATLNRKAPPGALVLFDGSTTKMFTGALAVDADENAFYDGATTKELEDKPYSLHLEFRLPFLETPQGKAERPRARSGVFLHDCYEIRLNDSFGDIELDDDACGSIVGQEPARTLACMPPMQWQTLDVEFTPPKFENGRKIAEAVVSAKLNGLSIHDNFLLFGSSDGRLSEGPGPRPIHFMSYGDRVLYRNVWLTYK